MNNPRAAVPALLMVLLLLIAAGCGAVDKEGGQDVEQQGAEQPEPIQEPEPEPEPDPGFAAPLTGVRMDDEAKARPVAVMINNLAPARPQSGLPHADVVWEVLAEGGITRLVAIFQSDESYTGAIGPIRSIRPYLIELAESYRSVIVHAGASPDAYGILRRQNKEHLDEITNAGAYFVRDKSRKAPHNLYSDLENLRAGAEKRGYAADVDIPAFQFLDDDAGAASAVSGAAGAAGAPGGAGAAGAPADEIDIRFSLKSYIVTYKYQADERNYVRFINGDPHTDLVSGDQLSTANIVVLGASHKVLDNEGRLAVDLQSGGPAMLFRFGEVIECTWERAADGVIRLMKNGSELPFARGKIYYHIVPDPDSVEDHVTIRGAGDPETGETAASAD